MKHAITTTAMALGLFLSPVLHAQEIESSYGEGGEQGSVSAQDLDWMKKSAQGDILEISLGNLAQSKAKESVARSLGAKLVQDHTKALNDLKILARAKGVALPSAPNPDQMVVIQYFQASKSPDWGHDYVKFEIYDHILDISETQKEISAGADADVKKEAAKDLPVLQEHLKLAQAADQSLGG